MAVSRIVFNVFANDGHTLLPTFPSFRSVGMVGEACLPSNAYYPRTPDYTLYSGVHVCWSEHSDSSFVYGLVRLIYGSGTMTTTTKVLGQVLQGVKFCNELIGTYNISLQRRL